MLFCLQRQRFRTRCFCRFNNCSQWHKTSTMMPTCTSPYLRDKVRIFGNLKNGPSQLLLNCRCHLETLSHASMVLAVQDISRDGSRRLQSLSRPNRLQHRSTGHWPMRPSFPALFRAASFFIISSCVIPCLEFSNLLELVVDEFAMCWKAIFLIFLGQNGACSLAIWHEDNQLHRDVVKAGLDNLLKWSGKFMLKALSSVRYDTGHRGHQFSSMPWNAYTSGTFKAIL